MLKFGERKLLLRRKVLRFILLYILMSTVCVAIVFPFYWMAMSSLQSEKIFGETQSLLTVDLNPESYRIIFADYPLSNWLANGSMVAVATAFFSICISCFAAYSLSRFNYRGKLVFSTLLLGTQMIPVVLLVIPLYIIFRDMGLLNNLLGLVVAYITFSVPLCTMLLKSFFDTVSVEIEEAALIDGCSRIGTFLRVTLPISLPGLAVTSLFAFLLAWNEYVFAATFLTSKIKYTTSIGLFSFIGQYTIEWSNIMAAAAIVTIPTFVVFAFIQKGLIKGLGTGALKG